MGLEETSRHFSNIYISYTYLKMKQITIMIQHMLIVDCASAVLGGDLKDLSGDLRDLSEDLRDLSGDLRDLSGDLRSVAWVGVFEIVHCFAANEEFEACVKFGGNLANDSKLMYLPDPCLLF